MTLYYYMYRSWQDCCRRGENRSWPSVSVEPVDSEYWCLNIAIVYAFIMRLTVEERVLPSTFKLNTLYFLNKKSLFFYRSPFAIKPPGSSSSCPGFYARAEASYLAQIVREFPQYVYIQADSSTVILIMSDSYLPHFCMQLFYRVATKDPF